MNADRPDVAAAVAKMTTKVGAKREIKKLPEHLTESEQVAWLAAGMYGGGMGLLALTDRRLFFLKDGMMSQTSEDFPLDRISSIQWSSGMLQGKIQVFVSGNKTEITNVAKVEGKAIVDSVRDSITSGSVAAAPPAPAPQGQSSDLEQLTKLAELHKLGILTDEEFAAKKAQILGV